MKTGPALPRTMTYRNRLLDDLVDGANMRSLNEQHGCVRSWRRGKL